MKTNSILKTVFKCTVILSFATLIASCKKDDIDESGSANVKIINASPGSSAQSFFLADRQIVQGGLSYGNASEYIVTNSGNNLEAEFRNEGSTSAYASDSFDLENGTNNSIFVVGDGQSARVLHFGDDLTPVSGQAKVRIAHFSDAAPDNVDVRRASGENIATNIERDNLSGYVNVTPGLLSIQVFETGQTVNLGNFDVTALLPGKIYTIYISGSTPDAITVSQVVHN